MPEELEPSSSPSKARTEPLSEDSRPAYVNVSDAVHEAQKSREKRDRNQPLVEAATPSHTTLKNNKRKAAATSERKLQKLAPLAPEEVASVRRKAYNIISKQIPAIGEVLDGTREWNAQQVRLFSIMLNKVMPDLHHSFNEVSIEDKSLTELSIKELEAIVKQASLEESRANIEEAITTIEDAEYTAMEPESPLENDLLATPDAPLFIDDSLDDPAASPVQMEDL